MTIPETFEAWKHCIVKECKINLDKNFAQGRLKVYLDPLNTETLKFASLYGQAHLNNIIAWLKMV
jgi:hypothetical protein